MYNQTTPPMIDLTKIGESEVQLTLYLASENQDPIINYEDVILLMSEIQKGCAKFEQTSLKSMPSDRFTYFIGNYDDYNYMKFVKWNIDFASELNIYEKEFLYYGYITSAIILAIDLFGILWMSFFFYLIHRLTKGRNKRV